jgi:hypothetical protein
MFTSNDSDRFLTHLVAGLALTVTFVFGALAHAVIAAQPLV